MKTYFPNRMTSGRPAMRENQYITVAPIHEPTAPATTSAICPGQPVRRTPKKSMPLVHARCAAGGTMTSLGSGTIELSIAISSSTSAKPPASSDAQYHSSSGCRSSCTARCLQPNSVVRNAWCACQGTASGRGPLARRAK